MSNATPTASHGTPTATEVPTLNAGVLNDQGSATNTTDKSRTSAAQSGHSIVVNQRQKGNPILKHIRNVPWEFGVIVPDYELGRCICALFLSLRYHNRYPDYIHSRLHDLGKSYELRVLLVMNDVGTKGPKAVSTGQQDVSYELNQLAKICILADCTLIVAFSTEEAARYLEVYKAYENKPPTDIMPKTNTDYLSQVTDVLTSVKGVNKTDCISLLKNFKTLSNIIEANADQLSLCPGIGPMKAQRLHKTFNEPFVRETKSITKQPNPSEQTRNDTATKTPAEVQETLTGHSENIVSSEEPEESEVIKKRKTVSSADKSNNDIMEGVS